MWLNYNWEVAPSCTLMCMIGHVDTATLTSPGSKKRCSCCRLAVASVCVFFLKSPKPYTSTNLAVCTSQEPQEPKEQPQPCQTIYIFLTRIGYRGYRPPTFHPSLSDPSLRCNGPKLNLANSSAFPVALLFPTIPEKAFECRKHISQKKKMRDGDFGATLERDQVK